MKAPWVLVLWATLAVNASAADISGTWKAWFVGDVDARPRFFSEAVLNVKVDGNKLSGTAHMGNWPGVAPISDGKIDGDKFSFTAIGKFPWTRNASGTVTTGYPRLRFAGTVQGNEMTLTMIWDSIIAGERNDTEAFVPKLEMRGKKTSD